MASEFFRIQADDPNGIQKYFESVLNCNEVGHVPKRKARIAYLLLLGQDVRACKNFVDPDSGAIVRASDLCKEIRKLVGPFRPDQSLEFNIYELKDRYKLYKKLFMLDVKIFYGQKFSPESLLQAIINESEKIQTTKKLPITELAAAAKQISKAYSDCKNELSVSAARCFREKLCDNEKTKSFYTASMVFDTSGRLRTNADAIRAFFYSYENLLLTPDKKFPVKK